MWRYVGIHPRRRTELHRVLSEGDSGILGGPSPQSERDAARYRESDDDETYGPSATGGPPTSDGAVPVQLPRFQVDPLALHGVNSTARRFPIMRSVLSTCWR